MVCPLQIQFNENYQGLDSLICKSVKLFSSQRATRLGWQNLNLRSAGLRFKPQVGW